MSKNNYLYPCPEESRIIQAACGEVADDFGLWNHLLYCERCQRRYRFYNDLRLAEQHVDEKSLRQFGRLIDEDILALQPLVLREKEGKYQLAAKTAENRYEVQSFSDEKSGIVARLMRDRRDQQVSLHLLAEDAGRIGHKQVHLLPADLQAITDDRGVAQVGRQEELHCSGIEIRSAKCTFDLTPIRFDTLTPEQSHSFLLKSDQLDEINITIEKTDLKQKYRITIKKLADSSNQKQLHIVAFTDRQRTIDATLQGGASIFELEALERILNIHIF
ncbi:hypothetical protein JXO59_01565 [candidate division KSB1 bacterium]|nr:hypothetical protein [candidate division KSB1 bacterium]